MSFVSKMVLTGCVGVASSLAGTASAMIIVDDDVDGNGDTNAIVGTIDVAWGNFNNGSGAGTLEQFNLNGLSLSPLADDVDAGFADGLLTRVDATGDGGTPFFNSGETVSVTYGGAIAAGTYTINLQIIDYNNNGFAEPIVDFAGLIADPSSTTPTPVSGDDAIWTLVYEVGAGDAAIGDVLALSLTGGGAAGDNVGVDHVTIDFVPIPEPGSLALFGLGGLLLARRRRG